VPLTATSSAEITIPGSGVDGRYICLRPTVNCHIAFHIAGMNAATTSDMLFFGGQTEEYIVPMEVDFYAHDQGDGRRRRLPSLGPFFSDMR
jgi:hypothetical protein